MPDLTPPKETQEPAAKTAKLPAPAPAALPEKSQSKVKVFVLIGGIALVLTAAVIVGYRMVHRGLPEGLIQANGRIEGDRISVASKFAGRISRMFVREGDSVTNGQVLAVLEEMQFEAKVSQALAASRALAAQLQAAQTSLEVMKLDVPMGIEIAQAGVAHAQALLAKANAGENQAQRDAKRFRELLAAGSVDNHRSEMSDLAAIVATSEREAARTGLTHAEKQLAQARLGKARIQAQSDSVAALASQLDQGRAVHVEAESVLKDLTLIAPITGVITTRVRDAGEVIAAGSPVLDLVNLDRLYLKVYVPESMIGKLHLDLPARIHIDALPDQSFAATTRYIASRAEFTPKEVQTSDERVKLVFAVKLYLTENPSHRLSPGLPADAVIRWQEGIAWQNPRW